MAASNLLMQKMTPFSDACSIKALLKYLEKVYGAVGDYVRKENDSPKCMFFQDSCMKDLFNFYPDRICIDCSLKKFEIDLFILFFLCEDSNGRNFIVGVGFLQHNDVESLTWLFETFKKHNPNWRKIRTLSMDPGVHYWDLVKEMFSYSCVLICPFHALKSFEFDVNKVDVSEVHKKYAIELFKALIYSKTNSDFEEQLQKFNSLPEVFVSYLFEVWLPHKPIWRLPLDFAHEDVFKIRNAYLKELNNAVQMIYEGEKSYIEFIKKIFLMILLKKREKVMKSLELVSMFYSKFSPEYQICKTLTPYAAEFVIKQLDLSQEISTEFNPLSEYYTFRYLDMVVKACATSCECNFYQYTLMTCRHIFCARKTNYFCLFDGSNTDNTWNKQYYQHASTCMEDYLNNNIESRIPQDIASRTTLASHLFEITTPILLDLSTNLYESHIKVLKNLVKAWKMDNDVSVKFIGIEKSQRKNYSCTSKCISSFLPNEAVSTSKALYNTAIFKSQEGKSLQANNCFVDILKDNFCLETREISDNSEKSQFSVENSLSKDCTCTSKVMSSFLPNEAVSTAKILYNTSEICKSQDDKSLEANDCFVDILKDNFCFEMNVADIQKHESLVLPHEPKRASRQRPCDTYHHNLLNGKHINITYIVISICLTKERCVNWLKTQGFLAKSMKCTSCNGEMISKNLSRLNDGVAWRCMNKICVGKKSSVRVGTWFEESNLTLQQMLLFTYMWLNKFPKERIIFEMSITPANYVKWDKFHRRVCEEALKDYSFTVEQAGPSNYQDLLDKWLQKHSGKDTFLEFLKDVAQVYGKIKEGP